MAREINFLTERRKQLSKVEVQDKRIMRVCLGVFGCVFLMFLIVLGARFYMDRQLFQVQAAQKVARAQIVSNESIERSFVIFVHKLSTLAKISQDRQEKNATIEYFNTIFGQNILIKGIEFDQKEKLLIFRMESKSIFDLRRVFTILNSEDLQKRFSSMNLSDLSRNDEGYYEVTVAVVTTPPSGATAAQVPQVP